MRDWITLAAIIIVGLWIYLIGFLLGIFPATYIDLKLPVTTADFADSTGILNGVLSSIAVLLALVAVLLQGRELKESTKAQEEQALALKEQLENQKQVTAAQLEQSEAIVRQLEQQQTTNKIMRLQALLSYHAAEMERMQKTLDSIKGTKRSDKLWNNSLKKKNRHKASLDSIQDEIEKLL